MSRSAKTVSLHHLHAAVKTALEAAKKKHSDLKLESLTDSGSAVPLSIYYRYPWICGLPAVTLRESELDNLAAFNNSFVSHLAKNPDISAVAADGKFTPALQVSGGNVAIGFTPADVSFTE